MNTKVIIFHHGQPESADKLYVQLSSVFTDVELWDSGSPSDKIPIHVTHVLPNIYASGMWKKVLAEYASYDAVWIVCADVVLQDEPSKYKESLESCAPFGIWSPCIEGRAHPFMLKENYTDKSPKVVRNIESQAMALGGGLLRSLKEIEGGKYGFGVDYWFCRKARDLGLSCIIDGRVSVYHPAGTGYNEKAAHDEMEKVFGEKYGKNFRQTLFEYSSSYEGNLMSARGLGSGVVIEIEEKKESKVKVKCLFTIDNGWGVNDFLSIASQFPMCPKLLLKKGVSPLSGLNGVEVAQYDGNLERFADGKHIGVFHKIGPANFEDFKKLVELGVPVVANVACHRDVIVHEKTGFVYGNQSWACQWIRELLTDDALWDIVKQNAVKSVKVIVETPKQSTESVVHVEESVKAEEGVKVEESDLVTVITPTFRREPRVVRRCVNCLQLQTYENWEQLICSDGAEEVVIKDLVESLGDKRVTYQHTTGKKPGDFGNTVRSEMLKKANGKYVMFCDDDNVIVPVYMEKMVKALRDNPEASFAIARVVHFGPLNEQEVGKAPKVLTGIPPKLFHIDSLQVLVKKEAMLDVGWDTEHGYVADGYSLQKLAEKYKYVEVQEVLGFHL